MDNEIGHTGQKAVIKATVETANKYNLSDLLKLEGIARVTFHYQRKLYQNPINI